MAAQGRWRLATLVVVAMAVVGGCDSGDPAGGHHDSPDLAHVHGLGVNPADGKLYVGSHHGLFVVTGKGEPEQVAGRTQDFMGFTVLGPDHFLGSGHPGPDDTSQPPHLGLIESTDAGKSWQSVSLSGEADFHALESKHGRVYGFDIQTGQILTSKDRKSWQPQARLPLADIAVSPTDAETVLATTQQGVARSTDGARTFTTISGSPTLIFIDWASERQLVGVAPDGTVYHSANGGKTWSKRGSVDGQPQAIVAHGESDVYVATETAIHRSSDGGTTFRVLQAL